ncbi:hypothetical protein EUGRSUZ_E01712 [Eucalyptus grandis]|uniref:Uncharacterized protein n=2 Tax=Eucalyptus grandis TaxID=71139 RepID=A0ACC3KUY0_EUCGR|nr:hypothetical protein EUGRSUZ_E01712 [Eucalyptus grandis]
MERMVLEAARKGNIDELKDLIGSNQLILEEMALEGAGHTSLHVACVGGHLDFVGELLKHMPKLAEKVNLRGFSPLHIAAARGDVEIVVELLKVGTHLCSVKGWERRIHFHGDTAIHLTRVCRRENRSRGDRASPCREEQPG